MRRIMGVDEIGVDEVGVDKLGNRRSGTTPSLCEHFLSSTPFCKLYTCTIIFMEDDCICSCSMLISLLCSSVQTQ